MIPCSASAIGTLDSFWKRCPFVRRIQISWWLLTLLSCTLLSPLLSHFDLLDFSSSQESYYFPTLFAKVTFLFVQFCLVPSPEVHFLAFCLQTALGPSPFGSSGIFAFLAVGTYSRPGATSIFDPLICLHHGESCSSWFQKYFFFRRNWVRECHSVISWGLASHRNYHS